MRLMGKRVKKIIMEIEKIWKYFYTFEIKNEEVQRGFW